MSHAKMGVAGQTNCDVIGKMTAAMYAMGIPSLSGKGGVVMM